MTFVAVENAQPPDRLIVAVWGEPKTGKTQFALTFPEPLYIMNLDWGLEHHLPRLAQRQAFIANYRSIGPDDPDEAKRLLREFEQDYGRVLRDKKEGTIIIDTVTQLWQIASRVFLEDIMKKRRDGQVYPFDYAKANAYFQNLLNQVKETPLNLALVSRAREKYNAQGQPSGIMEIQGNSQVPYLVQIVLHMTKESEHKGTIDYCWQTSTAEGQTLVNPTYESLRTLVHALA